MKSKRVMLFASGGGHWTQLMRLRPAFERYELVFVGVKAFYREDVGQAAFEWVPDVSRLHKWSLPYTLVKLVFILLKHRPAMIVTTGSMPGMLALRLGKFLLGAKTVWIDSVANVEEMSMSGRSARKVADVWLTQWPHLAKPGGPSYLGSVI